MVQRIHRALEASLRGLGLRRPQALRTLEARASRTGFLMHLFEGTSKLVPLKPQLCPRQLFI
jgi:hypothetical protein